MVTDRITGLSLGSTGAAGLAVGSAGFPIWDLYTSDGLPPASLVRQLRSSGYQYLVIDKRLAVYPIQGADFDSDEPQWTRLPAFTPAELSKFDSWSWTPKVYESQNYAVYQFDFSRLPAALMAARTTPISGGTR